jgi:hypothetical protein
MFMATSIQYNPPPPQVILTPCCYTSPGSADIHHGSARSTYINGDELMMLEIVNAQHQPVAGAVQVACPVAGPTVTIGTQNVLIFQNRYTFDLVIAVTSVVTIGIESVYYNIDGSLYIGVVGDLILVADKLNYSPSEVICANGTDTVTRTDVWDENRVKVATIWQDLRGAVVAEPTGTLTAGSCDRPLDVEVQELYDNFLDPNGDATGDYVPYVQVLLLSTKDGTISTSHPRLVGGGLYNPTGSITRDPMLPPVVHQGPIRYTNGQRWTAPDSLQAFAWTVEYANRANQVKVGPTELSSVGYHGGGNVNRDKDGRVIAPDIVAEGRAIVLVTWEEQRKSRDVSNIPDAWQDTLIPIPADLLDSGWDGNNNDDNDSSDGDSDGDNDGSDGGDSGDGGGDGSGD